jgi:hypothetical protein
MGNFLPSCAALLRVLGDCRGVELAVRIEIGRRPTSGFHCVRAKGP